MRRITFLSLIAVALLGLAVFIHPAVGVTVTPPSPGGSGPGGTVTPTTSAASATVGDVLTLSAALSNSHVLQGSDGELLLELTVTGEARERQQATARLPMNLAIVIDRSPSMLADNKIHYAKRAAEALVEQLQPDDRVALVAFDAAATIVLPSHRVANGTEVKAAIRSLDIGSATNVHAGMTTGAEQVARHLAAQQINRVIILSDGETNTGVTDPDALANIASSWAGRGIGITTMGVGVDFNEDLMVRLADHGAGNYYYINEATQLAAVFERELNQLAATVAQETALTVTLADGVQCTGVPGYTFQQAGQRLTIPLGDVPAGATRRILARLRVPTADAGPQRVAQTVLAYTNGANGRAVRHETPMLVVQRTASEEVVAANHDLDVLEQNERVQAAETVEDAMAQYEAGDREGAQSLLHRASSLLRRMNDERYRSPALSSQVEHMEEVAAEMETAPAPASTEGKQLRKAAKAQSYEYKK